MAIPELVRKSAERILEKYCREKVPPCLTRQARLRFHVREDQITLFAERILPDRPDEWVAAPVAQLRFNREINQWTLHYPDRRGGWRFYLSAGPSLHLEKLLRHLDEDPMRVFWG